jgi:hypothetical protein
MINNLAAERGFSCLTPFTLGHSKRSQIMRDAKERDEALTTWQKQNATQHTEVEKRPEWIPNSKKDESPTLHIFDIKTEKRFGIDPGNPPLNVSKFDIPKSRV